MELVERSETSAYYNFNQTPGKYPKEYIHLDIISVCGSIPIEIPILWPRAVMVGPRPRVLLTLPLHALTYLQGSWPLKMGAMGCPETSATNYQYTLRNIPQKCRYHFLTSFFKTSNDDPTDNNKHPLNQSFSILSFFFPGPRSELELSVCPPTPPTS